MKVLKSDPRYCPFAVTYPSIPDPDDPSRILPSVTLPSGRAYGSQRAQGAVNYIELSDDQVRRLEVDAQFRSMLEPHGNKAAAYQWTKYTEIPEFALPQSTITTRLQQENARLRAELRKRDTPLPDTVRAEPPAAAADDTVEELHPGESIIIEKVGGKSRARKAGPMKVGGQSGGDILSGLPS